MTTPPNDAQSERWSDIDTALSLPVWEARQLIDVKPYGRTKPPVVACELVSHAGGSSVTGPVTSVRKRFVLKCQGQTEVRPSSLYNELFASLLARHLGLNSPVPIVVRLSAPFVKSANRNLIDYGYQVESGIGFGSEEVTSGLRPVAMESLTPIQKQAAAQIYAFDMFVWNPDRRESDPNCMERGDGYLIFDHDCAFSFVYDIIRNQEPWKLDARTSSKHLFAGRFYREELDWNQLMAPYRSLSGDTVRGIHSAVPTPWNQHGVMITKTLSSILDHLDTFEMELLGSIPCKPKSK